MPSAYDSTLKSVQEVLGELFVVAKARSCSREITHPSPVLPAEN